MRQHNSAFPAPKGATGAHRVRPYYTERGCHVSTILYTIRNGRVVEDVVLSRLVPLAGFA